MPSVDKIKTPLTMSPRESVELLVALTKRLDVALERMEQVLGPPPRPELTLVREEEDDA